MATHESAGVKPRRTISLKDFSPFLLSFVIQSDPFTLDGIVHRLHEWALELCNTQAPVNQTDKSNSNGTVFWRYASELREQLEAYRGVSTASGQDKYLSFTRLSKAILEEWGAFETEMNDQYFARQHNTGGKQARNRRSSDSASGFNEFLASLRPTGRVSPPPRKRPRLTASEELSTPARWSSIRASLTRKLDAVVVDKQDSQSMQTDSLDSASEFPYLIALLIVLKFFHHAQALSRRSADVIQVASDLVNLPKPNGTPKNVDIVAKVYWSEDTPRPAEDNLLEFAHAVLHGHHSYRCTLISPSFVRNKPCSIAELPSHFNIDDPIWRGVPSYYIPRPIHEIIQDDLFIAWTDCFKIHFELWKQGSHHRNITPDNLMYVRDSEGHVVGALNDFDIVAPGTSNSERSGSFAFMATDLMKHKPPTTAK